jgi:release factor glutamine methyltransferase
MKNFNYYDLTIETHPEVYEPAEDTFQLLEAIQIKKDESVLEIGTGCGLIALVCAQKGANVVCTDINPYAIELTRRNFEKNMSLLKGSLQIREGNLFSVLNKDELFDVIIYNPPYIPTSSTDLIGGSGWFDKSVDGGKDGLKVTRRFIEGLKSHLTKMGRAYFVFSSLSDQKLLNKIIAENNLKSEIINTYNYNDERIEIILLTIKK